MVHTQAEARASTHAGSRAAKSRLGLLLRTLSLGIQGGIDLQPTPIAAPGHADCIKVTALHRPHRAELSVLTRRLDVA